MYYRRIVWEKNLHHINQHNLEADLGLHSYRLGINEYSDLVSTVYKDYSDMISIGYTECVHVFAAARSINQYRDLVSNEASASTVT